MKKNKLVKQLESIGYEDIVFLRGKGLCGIHRFIFTTDLCVGLGEDGYVGRYSYSRKADAVEALNKWKSTGESNEDPKDKNWTRYISNEGSRLNFRKAI